MKRFGLEYGIAPWKIDSPVERFLSRKADYSEIWKRIYVFYYRIFDSKYYIGGLKLIEKNSRVFNNWGGQNYKALERDMIYSLHRFGCMFDEYFIYNFPLLNVKGREEFITDKERWSFYARLNNVAKVDLFDNKGKTVEKFKAFYNREVCIVKSAHEKSLMDDFVSKHQRIIIKPLDSSGGRGVIIVTRKEYVFEQLLKDFKTGFLAEEIVSNCAAISQFNPSSLNTVRITTIREENATDILFSFIRFGRAGKCVDNGFSGGIISNIDIETGVITSSIDENNNRYINHPDSKKQIIGFKIPRWEEAIKLAKKLSDVVPEYRFAGWDLALTENGWVMIEGNGSSQFVGPQMSERTGIKNKLLKYLK